MSLDLRFYFAVFLRRLHYFIVISALVTASAVALAFMLPPVYRAESTLLVEASQIPGSLAETTIETAATERLQIIEQRLLTRANLLDIAQRFEAVESSGGEQLSADAVVRAMRERTSISMQSGQNQATIMVIAFESRNAQVSAAVVNEYVTLILNENVEIRTDRARQTLQFFEDEVAELGRQLDEASARIVDFQNQNADALPASLDFRLNQQLNLTNSIAGYEREVASLRSQKDRLVAVFNTTGRVSSLEAQSPEAQRLSEMRNELARLTAVLSDENPRVKMLSAEIRQLEEEVRLQSPSVDGEPVDPAATMLDIQLADIDSRIQILTEQKAQAEEQLTAVTDTIERTSQNQIALAALQREFEIIEGQYDTAVDRLQRSATSERIEMLAKGERISVIEAAVPPERPTSPPRRLIAAGGAFLGAGLGLAAVILVELLNNAVRRPKDLIRAFGITPLATVPYVRTPAETLMRRSVIGGLLFMAVVGLPAILYAVHIYYVPIDLWADRIAARLGIGT